MLTSSRVDSRSVSSSLEIMEDSKAFASYSKGLIYVGDIFYLREMNDSLDDCDIFVLDQRYRIDSNMKILSSCYISDKNDKEDIVKALLMYEKKYPSKWDRSYESMLVEWEVHNYLYSIGYRIDRTTDVDFNNQDERVYDNVVLKSLLR